LHQQKPYIMKKNLILFVCLITLLIYRANACSNTFFTINQSICINTTFSFNNQNLSSAGTYYDTLLNYTGCDSIITLNLSVSSIYPVAQDLSVLQTIACSGTPLNFLVTELDTTTTIPSTSCMGISGGHLTLNTVYINTTGIGLNHSAGPFYNMNTLPGGLSYANLQIGSSYPIYEYIDTSSLYPSGAVVLMWIDVDHSGTFDANELLQISTGISFTSAIFNIPSTALAGPTLMRIRTVDLSQGNFNPCISYASGVTEDFKIYLSASNPSYVLAGTNTGIANSSASNSFTAYLSSSGDYFATVTNAQGCSVNTDTIFGISLLPGSLTILYDTVCQGAVVFNYQTLNTTGTYQQILPNTAGCDSVIILNLFSKIGFNYIYQSICHGGSFAFNGQVLTVPGTYYDTLTNYLGCDSLITLSLSYPTTYTFLYTTICAGNNYVFNNQTLYTSGYYYDTLVPANNCGDSLIVLVLTVDNPLIAYAGNDYILCGGTNVTLGGMPAAAGGSGSYTYLWSPGTGLNSFNIANPIASSSSGLNNYVLTVTDNYGCTATDTMLLNIGSSSSSAIINFSMCFGSNYLFNGNLLTNSGIYLDTITNYLGCDSTITLNLFVFPNSTSSISQSICNGSTFLFNGVNLSMAGTYIDTLLNYYGCDSIITLILSVNPTPVSSFTAIYQSCFHTDSCAIVTYTGSAFAGSTYNWSFSGGTIFSGSGAGPYIICFPSAGTHTIGVIESNNGCLANLFSDTVALSQDCVWPGDADNNNVVNNLDIFALGLGAGMAGPQRSVVSNIFIDQVALPWIGNQISGANWKHADCNGDGIIDENDTTAISHNYSQLHAKLKSQNTNALVSLTISPDTIFNNTIATATISLGTATIPLDSVYGIAFTFNYDVMAVDTDSVSITIPSSWLFAGSTEYWNIYKQFKSNGKMDVGLVRHNHIGKSGFGDIAIINLDITTDDLAGKPTDFASYIMNCTLSDVTVINLLGEKVPVIIKNDSAIVMHESANGISQIQRSILKVSPNPVSSILTCQFANLPINFNELYIFDMLGNLVLQQQLKSNKSASVNVSDLTSGIYLIKVGNQFNKFIKE
jgi:hypothetical protein